MEGSRLLGRDSYNTSWNTGLTCHVCAETLNTDHNATKSENFTRSNFETENYHITASSLLIMLALSITCLQDIDTGSL